MIEWKEEYSVGEAKIDEQHKQLFVFFNDIERSIEKGVGKEYVEECFEFFKYYAANHFSFEEGCMHRHQCPVAKDNKNAHQRFLDKINEFSDLMEKKEYSVETLTKFSQFCGEWLVGHIIGIDTQLKPCIHKKKKEAK